MAGLMGHDLHIVLGAVEVGKDKGHLIIAETGKFFNKMLDDELMDVLSTPGKAGGGYCTCLLYTSRCV